ncbi:hypothetical protein Tco_1389224 [Tanacetum coccineum]
MSSLDDVDDKTGLNLLKLLDGEKALHGEKSPGQGPLMISNPVDFPTDLGLFGNEFRLPKGNFEFGSSSGVIPLEDHPHSYIGGGDMNMTEMEHENTFGAKQAYDHPLKQQGFGCLNNQPDFAQVLAIAQSLNADMERILCNLRAENEDLKAKEKTDLTDDLGWVLKKGIPRALKRVFKSDEFQREISKLLLMMLEENRHQSPQNDFVPARVTKAITGLKNIKWGCMNDVIGAPVSLLRYMLRRHGEHSGQGPSA